MYYISSKTKNKYGVTDSNDNVEEFYTKDEVMDFLRHGICIYGVSFTKSGIVIDIFKGIEQTETTIKSLISNGWSCDWSYYCEMALENGIAKLSVGIVVHVDYIDIATSGNKFHVISDFYHNLDGTWTHKSNTDIVGVDKKQDLGYAQMCIVQAVRHRSCKLSITNFI